MKVYILMTRQKNNEPHNAGVFSSFDKAVAYFVRDQFKDSDLPPAKLATEISRIALKMAHNWADFGDRRAWIDEYEVDDRCEDWEKESDNEQ